MSEQRPAFRFRLPWSQQSWPAAPPPRSTVDTQTPIIPTPTQRPQFRPPGLAQLPPQPPPPPPPQAPPSTESTNETPNNQTTQPTNETQTTIETSMPTTPPQRPPFKPPGPSQTQLPPPQSEVATTQPTNETQTTIETNFPTTPPQRSPFRSPGLSDQTQLPPPQAEIQPRTKSQSPSPSRAGTQSRFAQPASPSRAGTQSRASSQPASPTRAGTQSRASSQPASPSRAGTQSRAASQPATPSRAGTQSRVSSQPASPSRAGTQSRVSSQPPSPSRAAFKSRTASQPSSPSRIQPSQTVTITRSPSRLASQPAGKISLLPSSPVITTTTLQPIESSPPNSNESLPSVSKKEAPKQAVSPSEELEPQPTTENTFDILSNSQNQTSTDTTIQPPVPVAMEASVGTQKLDSTTRSADLELLNGNPEAIKESEVKMTSSVEAYEETKQKTVAELLAEASKTKANAKEQPSIAFQTEQKQPEKQGILGPKEKLTTSVSNGSQAKTKISHSMDKSPASESRQKLATSNGARVPLQKEIRDDISKFVHKIATDRPKHPIDEKSVSVITLAGENRGASMHLGSETAKREGAIHIHRSYKINPDESAEATTDGEGSDSGKQSKDSNTREDQATKAYINSNIQGINNSIVFNSSITERNPGVHLALPRKITDPIKQNNKTESLETRKADFNVTPAEKLTYEPTVRRRCLRGLFMEPSDSDNDNLKKPRRHGCRYSCREKSKDNEKDVL